jgi:DNA-binding GntR family transcriptional regulator
VTQNRRGKTEATKGRTVPRTSEDPRTFTTRDHRAYASLFAMLRDRIESDYYTPGKPMPSIGDLCTETRLSRQTTGRALQLLENEGLIERVPGHGYFVADPLEPDE